MDAITDTMTRYYDDDQRVLLETGVDASETDVRYFVYGNYIDEVLVLRDVDSTNTVPDGDYFYGHDHLCSVVCLFDAAGNPAERYEYDAYGSVQILSSAFSILNSSQYANPCAFTTRCRQRPGRGPSSCFVSFSIMPDRLRPPGIKQPSACGLFARQPQAEV